MNSAYVEMVYFVPKAKLDAANAEIARLTRELSWAEEGLTTVRICRDDFRQQMEKAQADNANLKRQIEITRLAFQNASALADTHLKAWRAADTERFIAVNELAKANTKAEYHRVYAETTDRQFKAAKEIMRADYDAARCSAITWRQAAEQHAAKLAGWEKLLPTVDPARCRLTEYKSDGCNAWVGIEIGGRIVPRF